MMKSFYQTSTNQLMMNFYQDLNEPVAKELVQQDHNLDAAEVAGGQQQLIRPGN
jgi:hypothetical protein